MRFSRTLPAILLLPGLLSPTLALADASSAPTIIEPSYPLEPGHQKPEPLNPATLVQGPTKPPHEQSAVEAPIPRLERGEHDWDSSFDLGWFFAGQSTKHVFNGPNGSVQFAHSDNSNVLSLDGVLRTRPPRLPLEGDLEVSATTGRSIVTSSGTLGRIESNVEHLGLGLGVLGVIPVPKLADLDVLLGPTLEGEYVSVPTLTTDQTQLDVDNRTLVLAVPKLELSYAPSPNWNALGSVGYARVLASSGGSGDKAQNYKRWDFDLSASRYLVRANAVGIGIHYSDESLTWNRSAPLALADDVVNRNLRLQVFWHRDF